MFDVGFWELTIIAIVALLVIGPERLPGVARTAGLWFGKIRGFVTSVKADIDKELQADELKKILDRHAQDSGLHDIIEETSDAVKQVNQQGYLVRSIDSELQQELDIMSSAPPQDDPISAAAKESPARAFDHQKAMPTAPPTTSSAPPLEAPSSETTHVAQHTDNPNQSEDAHVTKAKE